MAKYQKPSTTQQKYSKEFIAERKAYANKLAHALSNNLNKTVMEEDGKEYADKNKSLLG